MQKNTYNLLNIISLQEDFVILMSMPGIAHDIPAIKTLCFYLLFILLMFGCRDTDIHNCKNYKKASGNL